jgi:hypothetical protein
MPEWLRLAIVSAGLAASAGSWAAISLAQEGGRPHHELGRDPGNGVDTDRQGIGESGREDRRTDNPSERAVERAQNNDHLDLGKRTNESDTLNRQQQAEVDARIAAIRDRHQEIHFDAKISDQINQKGWTESEVRDMAKSEPTGTSVDNTNGKVGEKGEPSTVYGEPKRYVVVNDKSRSVVQLSDRKDPNFVPDSRIQWHTK